MGRKRSTVSPASIERPGSTGPPVTRREPHSPVLWARQLAQPPAPRKRSRGQDEETRGEGPLRAVRIVDNPVNTYEEVMGICAAVLGVSLEDGLRIAYTVDHEGSCVVGEWPLEEAERIASSIRTIGIAVHVEPTGA